MLKPEEAAKARTAARLRYESTPATLKEVAKELGLSRRSIERWSSQDGGWKKVSGQHIAGKAQELADRHRLAVEALGRDASPKRQQQAVQELTEDEAAAERAALLVRHRREWQLPRALMAEAVRERSTDKAKMAKVIAETTSITQKGERLAWGLDTDAGTKVQVIIERE
jgi:hypothetical protein